MSDSWLPDPESFDFFQPSWYSRTTLDDGTHLVNRNGTITVFPPARTAEEDVAWHARYGLPLCKDAKRCMETRHIVATNAGPGPWEGLPEYLNPSPDPEPGETP